MEMKWYVLKNKEPVQEPVQVTSLMEYVAWMIEHQHECVVAKTIIKDGVFVSTVFIGVMGVLFETMTFGSVYDGSSEHTDTWNAAERMHRIVVGRLITDLE